MKKVIHTVCEEGKCPLCGGELIYISTDRLAGFHYWSCDACGATGREGYNVDEDGVDSFDGQHYYVRNVEGDDIEIMPPRSEKRQEDTNRLRTVDYAQIGVCPQCGKSDDFCIRFTNPDGESWYSHRCNICETMWRQNYHTIEIQDGYSMVCDSQGNELSVEILNRPKLTPEEVISSIPMCQECDSEFCAFNPGGICKYPLVYGKEPELTDDGCSGMRMKAL